MYDSLLRFSHNSVYILHVWWAVHQKLAASLGLQPVKPPRSTPDVVTRVGFLKECHSFRPVRMLGSLLEAISQELEMKQYQTFTG